MTELTASWSICKGIGTKATAKRTYDCDMLHEGFRVLLSFNLGKGPESLADSKQADNETSRQKFRRNHNSLMQLEAVKYD